MSLYHGLFVRSESSASALTPTPATDNMSVTWSEGLFFQPNATGAGPATYVPLGSYVMSAPASGFEYVGILQISGNDELGATPTPATPAGQGYALLGNGAGMTNTGATIINGDVDLSPAGAVTPGGWTVSGVIHNGDATAAQAKAAAQASFTAKQTLGLAGTVIPSALDAQTLTPGAYQFASGAATLAGSGAGTLILNGAGTYIIYTASSLTVGAGGNATVTLSGGATDSNVFWVVGSSATLSGAGTVFHGNILASSAISQTGAAGGVYHGSWAALNAAITFASATTVTSSATPASVPAAGTGSVKYGAPVAALSGLAQYPAPDLDNYVLAELFTPAAAMQHSTAAVTNANISNVVLSANFGAR